MKTWFVVVLVAATVAMAIPMQFLIVPESPDWTEALLESVSANDFFMRAIRLNRGDLVRDGLRYFSLYGPHTWPYHQDYKQAITADQESWQKNLVAFKAAEHGRIDIFTLLNVRDQTVVQRAMQRAAIHNQTRFLAHFGVKFDSEITQTSQDIPEHFKHTLLPSVLELNPGYLVSPSQTQLLAMQEAFEERKAITQFYNLVQHFSVLDVDEKLPSGLSMLEEAASQNMYFLCESLLHLGASEPNNGNKKQSKILARMAYEGTSDSAISLLKYGHRAPHILSTLVYRNASFPLYNIVHHGWYGFTSADVCEAIQVADKMQRPLLSEFLLRIALLKTVPHELASKIEEQFPIDSQDQEVANEQNLRRALGLKQLLCTPDIPLVDPEELKYPMYMTDEEKASFVIPEPLQTMDAESFLAPWTWVPNDEEDFNTQSFDYENEAEEREEVMRYVEEEDPYGEKDLSGNEEDDHVRRELFAIDAKDEEEADGFSFRRGASEGLNMDVDTQEPAVSPRRTRSV